MSGATSRHGLPAVRLVVRALFFDLLTHIDYFARASNILAYRSGTR